MIDVNPLVTHRLPLEESDRAFRIVEAYDEGVIKAVVLP